ncbi:hypothetical protein HPB50_007678 [Hyalomma asiaticum]|uniref:Uncharacterized protein n=1 Tax=Hyalomma asiaticum TaxID=266040 RepID=A0ACB7TEA0_HYAAI|nr:hypothetical protein HPB50_007678 [Hyalomma asiaticum]
MSVLTASAWMIRPGQLPLLSRRSPKRRLRLTAFRLPCARLSGTKGGRYKKRYTNPTATRWSCINGARHAPTPLPPCLSAQALLKTSRCPLCRVPPYVALHPPLHPLAFFHNPSSGIDVLFIREANFRSPLDVVAFRRDFRVDAFFSLTSSRACGVGVIFVSDRFRQKSYCTFGADGRQESPLYQLIRPRYAVGHEQFKDLHQLLLEPLPHVLLGDFNCVVDSQRDVRGPGQGGSTYQAKELVKILRHLSLTDVWVVDLPGNLSGKSDHLPLATTVRGSPGFSSRNLGWRLDPSLLHDEDCVQRVRDRIRESLENVPSLTPHVWDTLKEGWKKLLQEEGRDRKRQLSAQMAEILRRMRIVKEVESLTSCTREYLETLQATYTHLLQLKTRRPAKEPDPPDSSTDPGSRDVYGNGGVRITEAKRLDGSITSDPGEIADIFREYFATQFHESDSAEENPNRMQISELCQYLRRPGNVVVNGSITAGFDYTRGIRQGCPLGPTVFIISLEPLLAKLANNERTRGFPLTGTGEINVLAYADDISLFVHDTSSLIEFWNTFNCNSEVSGAKINEGKSKALLFGSFPSESLGEIQKVSMVKVLGIYFKCDGVAEATWQRALERAHLVATRIQHLDLTLRGKALAVKTSVLVEVLPSMEAAQTVEVQSLVEGDTFEAFVNDDCDDIVCEQADTDEAIVAAVQDRGDGASDDDTVEEDCAPEISSRDALDYVAKLKVYCAQNLSEKALQRMIAVEDEMVHSAVKARRQTKITAFFH